MSQPTTKSLFLLSILMGTLAFTYFNMTTLSFEIWFRSDSSVQYTSSLWLFSAIAFLSGLLIKIESLSDPYWNVNAYIFLIFNFIVLGNTLMLPYDLRDESTMVYVALVNSAWIYFLIGIGIFLRFLSTRVSLSIIRKLIIVITGIISGAEIYFSLSLTKFIYLIHLWAIEIIFIGLVIYISRQVSRTNTPHETS